MFTWLRRIFFKEQTPDVSSFYLSKDIQITGDVKSLNNGRIDGTIKGNIHTTGKLIIGKEAIIYGKIECESLIVFGTVHGDIISENQIQVENGGLVWGHVKADSFTIHPEAVIKGNISKNIKSIVANTNMPNKTFGENLANELEQIEADFQSNGLMDKFGKQQQKNLPILSGKQLSADNKAEHWF